MVMAGDPGIAFGMTVGAGLCTTLGAALAFCVPVENKRFLAVSLGIAAGVMVYVSLVEIFFKSLTALSDEWCPEREVGELCPKAYGATTGFFFAGLALCALLNALTHNLEAIMAFVGNGFRHVQEPKAVEGAAGFSTMSMSSSEGSGNSDLEEARESRKALMPPLERETADPVPRGWVVEIARSSGRPFFTNVMTGARTWNLPIARPSGRAFYTRIMPGVRLWNMGNMPYMDVMSHEMVGVGVTSQPVPLDSGAGALGGLPAALDRGVAWNHGASSGIPKKLGAGDEVASGRDGAEAGKSAEDQKRLQMTGLLTGIAIAIHNFPEGLATFVAAMADPSLGAAIAVAIAIHNVPEGVCVAMPVFYATGSKLKAFGWATLSGVSEPIGALFGWAVLAGDVSNLAYGAMFGLVAGMMIYISLAELLPSAYRHDHNPVVVTAALVFGMVAMALSLVLFVVV